MIKKQMPCEIKFNLHVLFASSTRSQSNVDTRIYLFIYLFILPHTMKYKHNKNDNKLG